MRRPKRFNDLLAHLNRCADVLQENLCSPAEALERFREISGCAELDKIFAPPRQSRGADAVEQARPQAIFFFAGEWGHQSEADALTAPVLEFQVGQAIAAAVWHGRNGCSLH
jgi:hypothetical protein